MAGKLTGYVLLRKTPMSDPVSFGPDDTLPEWAQDRLKGKSHLFGGETVDREQVDLPIPSEADRGDVDYAATGEAVGREPAATEQGKSELVPTEESDDEPDQPKGNASREAWVLFAEENGVPVTDEMGRDDIKAACAEAGVLED